MPKLDPSAVAEIAGRLRTNITAAVKVSDGVLRDLLAALLAEGHLGLKGRLRSWFLLPPGGPAPVTGPRRQS